MSVYIYMYIYIYLFFVNSGINAPSNLQLTFSTYSKLASEEKQQSREHCTYGGF